MATRPWQRDHADKLVSARAALAHIRSGQTLYVGSGAGEPFVLTETLADMAARFSDVEIIHLVSARAPSRLARHELAGSFRYDTLYVGRHAPTQAGELRSDFTPLNVSDLPAALADGTLVVDVAVVQVTPPDAAGMCSLGVAVDATKAAVETAAVVIAQVNERMPRTLGDSLVPLESLDWLVESAAALVEVPAPQLDPVSLTIGRHVASLIGDGSVLHVAPGPIGSAALRYLDTRRDLGIHTDILTDDLLRLIRSGAVTNRHKKIHKGKTVATMVLGTEELYRFVADNPYVEILPIDQVVDPAAIAAHEDFVSVHPVDEIELTGLARADTGTAPPAVGFPSSLDFLHGARGSKDGFSILALPSTTVDGSQ